MQIAFEFHCVIQGGPNPMTRKQDNTGISPLPISECERCLELKGTQREAKDALFRTERSLFEFGHQARHLFSPIVFV